MIDHANWPVVMICPYCCDEAGFVRINLDACLRDNPPQYPVAHGDPLLQDLLETLGFGAFGMSGQPCPHMLLLDGDLHVEGPVLDGHLESREVGFWDRDVHWFHPILQKVAKPGHISPISAESAGALLQDANRDLGPPLAYEHTSKWFQWINGSPSDYLSDVVLSARLEFVTSAEPKRASRAIAEKVRRQAKYRRDQLDLPDSSPIRGKWPAGQEQLESFE